MDADNRLSAQRTSHRIKAYLLQPHLFVNDCGMILGWLLDDTEMDEAAETNCRVHKRQM